MKLPLLLLAFVTTAAFLQAQPSRDARRAWERMRGGDAQDSAVPAERGQVETAPETVPTEPVGMPVPLPEPVVTELERVTEPEMKLEVEEEEVIPVVESGPSAGELAALAEVARDGRGFRNANYAFEIAEKGVLRRLTDATGRVLVDQFGAVNLQGSYLTPEGRRVWFYAGGVGNNTYTATVEKRVEGETVVFDVVTTHPRFTMAQTIRCLENAVVVELAFKPKQLRDARGQLSALLPVQVFPAILRPGGALVEAGMVRFGTQVGELVVKHDAEVLVGAVGARREGGVGATISETAVSFSFLDGDSEVAQALKVEIVLP